MTRSNDMKAKTMLCKAKTSALVALACTVTAQVFAALPLDEGEWPAVVPEFTPSPSARFRLATTNLVSSALCRTSSVATTAHAACSWAQWMEKFAQPVKADVRMIAGAPQFHLDGKPFFALWGGVRQIMRPDRRPRHSSAPLTVVTVYSYTTESSSCEAWWPSEDGFNPEIFDRQAELYCRENPDAYFVWDLVLYPPKDWAKAHPDDICMDDTGKPVHDGPAPFSFASKSALDAMERAMVKAIRYLEAAPYANRIIGYRINSGHFTEWCGWFPPPGRFTDFSPVAQKAFAEYVKRNHPEWHDAHIPTAAERSSSDSAARSRCAAYYDFYSQLAADDIVRLMRKAREIVGRRKLLGTYYGYVMTAPVKGNNQMRAQRALKHFLDAKAVDYLMSPQPYLMRGLGDICGEMKPFATLAANGVMSVIEDDTRTSNGPYNGAGGMQTHTLSQTLGILRRNAGVELCRRAPVFFYAIHEGTEFDFPEFAADMTVVRKLAEHCLASRVERHAEVAYVMSEKMFNAAPLPKGEPKSAGFAWQRYKKDGSVRRNDVTYVPGVDDVFQFNYTTLARAGAPVDYVLAEDLTDHPGNYKLYIEPDIIAGKIRFRTAEGVTEGDMLLKVDPLRDRYVRAGVHIYSRTGDPVEANDRLFSLHARFAGVKDIKLPRKTTVLDVFNKRIVAKDVDTFTFEAPIHSSWLFYLGDDAEALLRNFL